MKLIPENVPKSRSTHAHAAQKASRNAVENCGACADTVTCSPGSTAITALRRFGRNVAASIAQSAAISSTHFRIRQRLSMSNSEPWTCVMPESTCHATENDGERKKIHAKQVR